MNRMLKLKGQFKQKSKNANFGPPRMKSGMILSIETVRKIIKNLNECKKYWEDITLIDGALLSVEYVDIVSKSRRIQAMLPGNRIVGARFTDGGNRHIITYYLPKKSIDKTIDSLVEIENLLNSKFDKRISNDDLEIIESIIDFRKTTITKSAFSKYIVDMSNINRIFVSELDKESDERKIISIYETEKDSKVILDELGINIPKERIRNTTLLLDAKDINLLLKKAPYLIAMEVEDMSKIPSEEIYEKNYVDSRIIKKPTTEPVIGVIDTPFNKKVYFKDWVDDFNYVEGITDELDYAHGTGVTSIIVDGPRLNPFMDDECGNFRVRHFGLSPSGKYSSFDIMLKIEEIVKDNPDIKVWNLSLGSEKEIENNFISPEGSILDEIQFKYDVIFVVAGTNLPKEIKDNSYKVGAPADSINSIIVNPVNINGEMASYHRTGGVLSFYVKPDVCYFGGDIDRPVCVCSAPGEDKLTGGTSYAAPWISRKLAYLINILGFTKEEAKAILIDSCEKWNEKYNEEDRKKYGHGVVPTSIKDIVNTENDEIKFVISGLSQKYDTYNYQLPIPMNDGKYPFAAKATMCYFPKCERNQGVDYTNTEFELKIGRLKNKKSDNTYSIDTINNDLQDEDGEVTTEEKARREFRKWDNTKCIKEKFSTRSRDKKSYDNPLWGISVTTKNRLNPLDGENIKFGLVVTLKELHGVNRIGDFVQMCSFNQWFTEEVDIDNRIDIYNESEVEIEFDDN